MNFKLNNKGFTLIELLAVMLILVSISFVAVGSISESLFRRDIKECKEQQQLAVSAAKMYFSLDGKGLTSVDISTLKIKGYFSDDKKTDLLEGGDVIKMEENRYTYNGKGVGCSCDNSCE